MHRRKYVQAAALGAVMLGAVTVLQGGSATAATFNAPIVVTGANATEPGIEIAPDGTIYIHGPQGLPLGSPVWRSTTGGATWTQTSALTRAVPGGGDIDIAIQPNGKLAFTDLWLGSSTVGSSSDRGNTWTSNPMQGTPVQDRQWVSTTGNDIVYHVTHQLAAGLVVAKSFDGGVTYPYQSLAASTLDQQNCICPAGYLISEAGTGLLGTSDRVGVTYTTSTGVKFAKSVNGATTWTQSVIDPTGGASTLDAFPVVANAGGDNLVVVWLEVTNSSSRVMFSKSANWGSTWSTPTPIVTTGSSVFPWIDARGSKISISLYHTTATGGPDKVPNSAAWYIKYLDSTNLGASFSALDTADATSVKSGPICTDGINCGSDRELGDFQMVALDANLKANIAYVRSIDGDTDTEIRYVREA